MFNPLFTYLLIHSLKKIYNKESKLDFLKSKADSYSARLENYKKTGNKDDFTAITKLIGLVPTILVKNNKSKDERIKFLETQDEKLRREIEIHKKEIKKLRQKLHKHQPKDIQEKSLIRHYINIALEYMRKPTLRDLESDILKKSSWHKYLKNPYFIMELYTTIDIEIDTAKDQKIKNFLIELNLELRENHSYLEKVFLWNEDHPNNILEPKENIQVNKRYEADDLPAGY